MRPVELTFIWSLAAYFSFPDSLIVRFLTASNAESKFTFVIFGVLVHIKLQVMFSKLIWIGRLLIFRLRMLCVIGCIPSNLWAASFLRKHLENILFSQQTVYIITIFKKKFRCYFCYSSVGHFFQWAAHRTTFCYVFLIIWNAPIVPVRYNSNLEALDSIRSLVACHSLIRRTDLAIACHSLVFVSSVSCSYGTLQLIKAGAGTELFKFTFLVRLLHR